MSEPPIYITACDVCGERGPTHRAGCTLAAGPPFLAPDSAAFAGLAGEVVRALEPHTEADPAALLVYTLAAFGALVGSSAETRVGAATHPPAIYAAFIGRTARSRKGTSEREVRDLFARVEDRWELAHRVSGFGSGEAFITHAAEHPGQAIYMVEPEFARVLAVASLTVGRGEKSAKTAAHGGYVRETPDRRPSEGFGAEERGRDEQRR